MHHQRNKCVSSHLKSLGRIFFLLLQTQVCTGQPVVATIDDDVVLPCLLEPAEDVSGLTLEWARPDLDPRFVHVQRSGQELVDIKHKLFEGRTSMFIDEQKHGNVSLKLSKVRISDEGTYKCFIPELSKQWFVQLIVASDAASSPVISVAGIDRDSRGLVFQCESAGWYPKPEVFWLDGEGNLLSGSTEINQGPDGLYTVTSTVTVEKRSNFTCRVTQEKINRPRERHVHVPDDFFRVSTSSAVPIITGVAVTLAVCLLFVLAGGVFMWRRRQNITKGNAAVGKNQIEMAESVQEGEILMNNPSDSRDETFNHSEKYGGAWSSRFSRKQQRMKELEKEVESAKEEVTKLMSESKKLKEEKQQLQLDLDNMKTESEKQLLQEKKQHEETQKKLKEMQIKNDQMQEQLQQEKKQKEESERYMKNQIREAAKLMFENQNLIEEKQQLERDLDNMKTELEKQGGFWSSWFSRMEVSQLRGQSGSGSVCKSSDPNITVEVDQHCKFIRLTNTSHQEISVRGWKVKVLINKRKTFMFDGSLTIQAGRSINLWRPGCGTTSSSTSDLVWSDLNQWRAEDHLEVILYNNSSAL